MSTRNPAKVNPFAVTACVLAFIIPQVAVVFGHIARAQIRRKGERGAGLALSALIIGYFNLVMVLVAVVGVYAKA